VTFFEFKIQNSKLKMNQKEIFKLINSEYRLPLHKIQWSSISGGFKSPLIVFDFELIILNFELS